MSPPGHRGSFQETGDARYIAKRGNGTSESSSHGLYVALERPNDMKCVQEMQDQTQMQSHETSPSGPAISRLNKDPSKDLYYGPI